MRSAFGKFIATKMTDDASDACHSERGGEARGQGGVGGVERR